MVLDPGRLAGADESLVELSVDDVRDLARLRDPPRIEPGRFAVPLRVDATGLTGPRREEVDRGGWRLTSRHLYVPADAVVDQPVQRIVEAASRLPEGAAVTGWAALHLAGARWFEGVEADGRLLPVPLALGPHNRRPKDPATVLWREQLLPWQIEHRHGIPCRTVDAAVFDEMRRIRSVRHAVQVLEMAMFAELTSLCRFADYLATRNRRTWVGIAREALSLAQEGAESPQESRLRLVWVLDAELPRPLANVNVYGADGRFLGRADLLAPEAGLVIEYDGAHHRRPDVARRDVSRIERFRDYGLDVVAVVEGEIPHRERLASRLARHWRSGLATRRVCAWTLTPPDGVLPPLSLDRRLDLRELLATRS
ncbi:MAG: hypothetical protein KDB63_20120 [Nocardioidaceae bacterium]|nr:hypothetical protein [Nocardioidaceae bacterium]